MTYYKIIQNNEFIGAINSNEFVQYKPGVKCFLRTHDAVGEYAGYNGLLYRDTWMPPIVYNKPFEEARIIEITEEEYNAYIDAIEHNEVIPPEEPDPGYIPDDPGIGPDPNDAISIEFIRSSKIKEMTYKCQKAIEGGFVLGGRRYSLTQEDQLNLLTAQIAINNGEEYIVYHADGEDYRDFSAEEMMLIIEMANEWRLKNTIHLKALKRQINAAETIEEIAAITY